jgi:uncharacterized membrane protein YccF (DUF307 family)
MSRTITTTTTTSQTEYQTITFRHDRRGACSWILNILWLLIAGWHMFLTWFLTGIVLCCTCIGIPCGWQAIKISLFLLFPFGKTLTYTDGEGGLGPCCCCDLLLNILWAVTVGWILALQALVTGIFLMLTIIGIPFGWQCIKLMYICFLPFGKDFSAEQVETITVVVVEQQQQQQHHANYHSLGV